MRAEKLYHRLQHTHITKPGTQCIGRKARQRKQAFGAIWLAQQPAQSGKRKSLRITCGGCRLPWNCQPRFQSIEQGSHFKMVTPGRMAKRILVVEDNDLNRKLFCDVLKSQGFAVEPVADGHGALDAARNFVPNLIIMDIQLPNISGLDLIESAKADSVLRSIPVLAVTAYAGKGDEERIRDAGADGYLSKPVSIGPFLQAVRALL